MGLQKVGTRRSKQIELLRMTICQLNFHDIVNQQSFQVQHSKETHKPFSKSPHSYKYLTIQNQLFLCSNYDQAEDFQVLNLDALY